MKINKQTKKKYISPNLKFKLIKKYKKDRKLDFACCN